MRRRRCSSTWSADASTLDGETAMIDHMGLSVSSLATSRAFYEAALAPLGYTCILEFDEAAGFGVPPKPDFWLSEGDPGMPALHVAFRADTRAQVDAFYRAAIAAGGRDNGATRPARALPSQLLRRVRARSGRSQHRGGVSCACVGSSLSRSRFAPAPPHLGSPGPTNQSSSWSRPVPAARSIRSPA